MHSGESMEPDAVVSANAEATWASILSALMENLPRLAQDFVAEYQAAEPYPSDLVTDEDVLETAAQTLELLLHRLRGDPDPPGSAGLVQRLGSRRARQGIAQARLLRAARLDFRVIWLGLHRIAGDEGSAVLAANVTRLLDVVDGYIDELRDAHRAEMSRLDRHSATRRHSAILSLFSADAAARMEYDAVAARLRMKVDARYEIAAVVGDGIDALVQQFGDDATVGVYERVDSLVLFRQQTASRGWMQDLPTVTGGYVGDVAGLAAIPGAAKVATDIARSAPSGVVGLATQEDVWPIIARARLDEALPRFSRTVLEPLQTLPEHERDRLVEAVTTFMRIGSVKETAATLFCHRNTVVNRLRAFEEVTGFDPTIPADAAWILVALAPGRESTPPV